MKFFTQSSLLLLLTLSTLASASPSETNHFQFTFKGVDAENFRSERVLETSREYGPYGKHLMRDYSLGFFKKIGTASEFFFRIECQQRELNYRTEDSQLLDPACAFVYSTKFVDAEERDNSIESYTYIEMTPKVAAKMIQNLEWREYKNHGWLYFGCFDNRDSGCPNIRYTPASGSTKAEIELSYYKP